ncbi:pentapeptide repeat-containing protein [Streptomyces albicerus]|uniref:pentapeptide repeat-containing protein n=1 Tax=Streptomyces albicerus TaxID=2569859 RepID=UPI00124AF2BA|nr:pentapeptide repeat-containing protein [Streptomyces albicerus]
MKIDFFQHGSCRESAPDNQSTTCGAEPVVDDRCLAHLTPTAKDAYLAALSPGADIHAQGVTFAGETLRDLLDTLTDDRGRVQVGTADFGRATFTGNADFRRVIFDGDVDFRRVTFNKGVDFHGATFGGAADFANAIFTGEADRPITQCVDFYGATFAEDADFSHATFIEEADFGRATFSGACELYGGTFTKKAVFYRATFAGIAVFYHVTFAEGGNFYGATFAEPASFERAAFNGWASFGSAVVRDELRMEAVAKRFEADGMRGAGRMTLRLRAAEVDLTNMVLAGPVAVHGLQRPIPDVDESAFANDQGVVPPVQVISLRGVDAEAMTLTDVDLSECLFAGLSCADRLVLDGRCVFADDPRGRRKVLADEHHWRAKRAAQSSDRRGGGTRWWSPPPERDLGKIEIVEPARLEVLYRQLRKALEDSKNEPGAADFYYGEMEMRRAGARRGEQLLLWLYWLVSGYGLRAGRAITVLLTMVALLALGMKCAGFPGEPVPYLDALLYSLRATIAVDVKSTTVPENVNRWGQIFQILLRIVGPLLVALAAMAIRNRVKR